MTDHKMLTEDEFEEIIKMFREQRKHGFVLLTRSDGLHISTNLSHVNTVNTMGVTLATMIDLKGADPDDLFHLAKHALAAMVKQRRTKELMEILAFTYEIAQQLEKDIEKKLSSTMQ